MPETAPAISARPDGPPPFPAPDAGRLARNYLTLTAAEFLSKLITFFCFTWLGRVLGAERYGSLEFTLAVMAFFTLAADFGLGIFAAREIAQDPRLAPNLLRRVVRLRVLLALACVAAVAVFVLLIRKPDEVRQLIMLYGLSLLAWPLALQWFFQGHDRMDWVAGLSIVRQAAFAALVFLFMRPGAPLAMLGLFECASMLAVAAVGVFALRTRFGIRTAGWREPLPGLFSSLRQSAPIGLAELTWAFLWYFATVLLGFEKSDRSLGWFGASHRVTMALHTFVWLYFVNLLPSMSRCVWRAREDMSLLMNRSLRVAAWSSVFVAFTVTVFSERLLTLAYGAEFAPADRLLSVLVWMVPVAMLSGHYRYTLIAANLQRYLLGAAAAGAAVAVLASFVLIPRVGAHGAAVSLLAACTVEFAVAFLFVRRRVGRFPFFPALFRPAASVALSLACYFVVARWSSLAASFAAAYLYLLQMAAWEWRDLRLLFSLAAARFGLFLERRREA